MVGTLIYLPPEINKQGAYTSMVDTWAVGIITYMLFTM